MPPCVFKRSLSSGLDRRTDTRSPEENVLNQDPMASPSDFVRRGRLQSFPTVAGFVPERRLSNDSSYVRQFLLPGSFVPVLASNSLERGKEK